MSRIDLRTGRFYHGDFFSPASVALPDDLILAPWMVYANAETTQRLAVAYKENGPRGLREEMVALLRDPYNKVFAHCDQPFVIGWTQTAGNADVHRLVLSTNHEVGGKVDWLVCNLALLSAQPKNPLFRIRRGESHGWEVKGDKPVASMGLSILDAVAVEFGGRVVKFSTSGVREDVEIPVKTPMAEYTAMQMANAIDSINRADRVLSVTYRVPRVQPEVVPPFRPEEFRTSQHFGSMGLAAMVHPAFERPVRGEGPAADPYHPTIEWDVADTAQGRDRKARFLLALRDALATNPVTLEGLIAVANPRWGEIRLAAIGGSPFRGSFHVQDFMRREGFRLDLRINLHDGPEDGRDARVLQALRDIARGA